MELLLPGGCCLCQGEVAGYRQHRVLCNACQLEYTNVRQCSRCAAVLSGGSAPPPAECQWCRHLKLPFESITSVSNYETGLAEAVLRAKTSRGAATAWDLGILLAEKLPTDSVVDPLVVDVPMHWARRLRRGMSSAEMIARSIAARRGWQRRSVAKCCRPLAKQSELPFAARQKNVRGAFQVIGPVPTDRTILLVDDIMTTGSTLRELASTLRKAGAADVRVAVVARATGTYADV